MFDAPATVTTIVAVIGLVAALLIFAVIPRIKQRRYNTTIRKIKGLIKQLPATNAEGQFCLDEEATFTLADLHQRHPKWVDRGFALVLGDILDSLWNAKRSLDNALQWREAQRSELRERHEAVEEWQMSYETHQRANAEFYRCISARKDLKQPRPSRV